MSLCGPKSDRWLGIETLDDLGAVSAIDAYRWVKAVFPK